MAENHHLCGFLENIDPAAVYSPLTALADTQLRISGDDLQVPNLNQIVAISGGIDTTVESFLRLVSPSLRVRGLFYVEPTNGQSGAAQEPDNPSKVTDLRRSPLPLVSGEQLNAQTNSNPGAVQEQWALVWLAAGPIAPIDGPIFTVTATNASTLTANVWTNGALTFTEDLPRGKYQVVGMRARSAGLVAARLVFVGGSWRPGCIGGDAVTDIAPDMFRYGGFGVMGEFEDIEPPTVDWLSMTADTAQDVILDLIQVRLGPA